MYNNKDIERSNNLHSKLLHNLLCQLLQVKFLVPLYLLLLLIFLLHFIWVKVKTKVSDTSFNIDSKTNNLANIVVKTLGFTFLNPHVYSDTVFFLGNFSKSLSQIDKYYFGAGAAISSFLFFFTLGYLSKYFSKYLKSAKVWKRINYLIILFMSILSLTVLMEII